MTRALHRSSWALLVGALAAACASPAAAPNRHLLIVIDGLRPDYVTADVMPNLVALGKRGVVFERHHSVYPTVTRVNAASIATGAYPETHGLLGNTVFFPKVNAAKFLDTADRRQLSQIAEADGRILTAPTLAESLQAAGRRMLVISSGSGGSGILNNPTVAGGAVLHEEFTMPESLGDAMKAIGPAPGAHASENDHDRYAVDAFLQVGLPRVDPSVTVLWLGALDGTAHEKGVGAPETIDVLRHVDREIKRIEDGLAAAHLRDEYDIWVTSDHGFSTYTGGIDLDAVIKPFAGTLPDGLARIVTGGGAIYVRDRDERAIAGIVAALQRTAGVGAIFTAGSTPGALDGHVPGTLSFDAVRWTHDRSAQILYSPDWTGEVNGYRLPGTSASSGTAGHGSSSPWDVHNTLMAVGPDLKRGVTIDLPSATVAFAPTLLHLLGLATPPSMQGRVLDEALAGGASPPPATLMKKVEHTATTRDGSYAVTATFSTVESAGREHRYFDSAKATRK
jgi:predicted AlkP superfamily pyrophosphatase or phosphodiesterase